MVIFPCLAWKAQILYAFTTCLLKRLDRWINRGETGDQRGKWTCSRSHSKRLAENSPGAWSRLFPFHQSAQTAAQLPVILQRTASLLSFCRASGDECRRPGLRLLPEEPGTGRREHSPFPWAQSVVENGQGITALLGRWAGARVGVRGQGRPQYRHCLACFSPPAPARWG